MKLVRAAAVCTHEANGVRIVNHHHGVVTLGQIAYRRKIRNVAIHRKHAVRCDQPVTRRARLFQLRFEVVHIAVFIAIAFGFREPYAVDDARVVQFIGNDGILLVEQRFEKPAVRVEAGAIENRVLGAQEVRQPFFQFLVNGLRAADKTNAGEPVAPVVKGFPRRLHDGRVIRQAQIVIGTEIQDGLAG